MTSLKNPLVSVIISTKNEERNMPTVLDSVSRQTYPHWELIVVDNHSKDLTQEISRKFTDKVFVQGPERSTQRNYGVSQAQGKYVLILDADMKLDPEVLEEAVALAESGQSAIIIPEESYGEGFWAQCKWVERHCYQGEDTVEAARFFERKLYLELGGFDVELISGEDWDLSQRIRKKGCSIGRIQALIHHNEWNLTLADTLRKKYYYGHKIAKYKEKNPQAFQSQAKLFRPCFWRHRRFLLSHPLYTLGMFFMKSLEFTAAGLGWYRSQRSNKKDL